MANRTAPHVGGQDPVGEQVAASHQVGPDGAATDRAADQGTFPAVH
jgi:hypothetical protein